jgi:hypothetical protein
MIYSILVVAFSCGFATAKYIYDKPRVKRDAKGRFVK